MADRVINQAAIASPVTAGSGLSGASIGVKLSYTVPAGRNAVLRFMGAFSIANAPTIAPQVVIGGNTYILDSFTAGPKTYLYPISLNAGDTAQFNVTVGAAGGSFNGIICADEYLTA